jgi:tRNA nucleotidyltransferase/poly(A) polymerase
MSKIDFKIEIPKTVKLIYSIFKNKGFELYPVGGCVRDSLIGSKINDWDLVTNAEPDKIIELLKTQVFVLNILETGKAFGVINVITNEDEYEIATMREDIGSDGRRPNSIKYTNIETDMLRRDFSCNALFYDIENSQIVDLVNGIADIQAGVIRTVGNPVDRFTEDKLRKLRALRFAARFDSTLECKTSRAIAIDSDLTGVSPERIRDEFLKGVKTAKSVRYFLNLLNDYDMLKWIFKGLTIRRFHFIEERNPIVLIAYLLNGNLIEDIEPSLVLGKYTADEINGVKFLFKLYWFSYSDDSIYKIVKQRILCKLTDDEIRLFLCKKHNGDSIFLDKFLSFKLTVTGADVEKLGIKPGPEMGKKIEELESINFEKHLYE